MSYNFDDYDCGDSPCVFIWILLLITFKLFDNILICLGICYFSIVIMSKCTIILFIYVFLCPECSCFYLYCFPVMLCFHFSGILNIAIHREVLLTTKPGSTNHLFLKFPAPSQEYSSCYIIFRFLSILPCRIFCCTSVCLLLRCFPRFKFVALIEFLYFWTAVNIFCLYIWAILTFKHKRHLKLFCKK